MIRAGRGAGATWAAWTGDQGKGLRRGLKAGLVRDESGRREMDGWWQGVYMGQRGFIVFVTSFNTQHDHPLSMTRPSPCRSHSMAARPIRTSATLSSWSGSSRVGLGLRHITHQPATC